MFRIESMKLLDSPMLRKLIFLLGLAASPLSGCAEERWYDEALVAKGEPVFQQHCSGCHGINAEGTANWKQKTADGHYPPPPLDGSAHTWHHSMDQLTRSIKHGGAQYGGVMPPFEDKLSEDEIKAIIAFFQSRWPDQIYQIWLERN